MDDVLNALSFRNIGPFRTAAWITEMAVPETPARDHLYTIYAATRSGGLWKTVNNGITWDPISDSVSVAAVGAVALAPSNPQIVWMGAGANDLARSSYSGEGVYKSVDAGRTWQLMGLPDSHHIARIVIHPKNPDTVYVAAIGHLFSKNEERGVFRTLDGGKTWQKVLYVNDGVGAIDLVLDRRTPTIALRRDVRVGSESVAPCPRRAGERACTDRATPARSGSGSKAACRAARSGASDWTCTRRTRTSCTRSSRT